MTGVQTCALPISKTGQVLSTLHIDETRMDIRKSAPYLNGHRSDMDDFMFIVDGDGHFSA